ncbi:ANTAR domain-containing protein [Mycolicibacterium arseniciresistens]|uniref:ANTAR domain-containing protein n=1 Tax=Mycolicibacterium arseniciresistens TaxID=3062257 RepID=A0ABT8UG01_9MYCO|nr:ANTAR domain-containing protein [Mycolicibacterium arseniciresistens]MDO3635308.1 ANTAR domain-containing protein [Mycolicibacterium arseniciresistens]
MVLVNEPTGAEGTHLRIAEIVQELHGRSDTDSEAVLAELVEHAAVEIPGAQYAGITVTRDARHIDTPAASHKWPMMLDEIQQRHSEGPCLTAAWDEKTILVDDLEQDDRFPLYRRDVLEQTPIRTIMSFQLFIADETMGALNVYAEEPGVFGVETRDIGVAFAAHSSVAWNSARREDQFKRALASRDIIGQAKGMVMERYGVDAVQAFALLRKLSQDANVPLAKIAEDLIETARTAH